MNLAKNISIFYMAIRPKTLGVTISPVLIGTTMAFSANKGHFVAASACLISALLIQIGTNLSNDYFDYVKGSDTDERLGPTRVTQSGLISPERIFRISLYVFGLAILIGIYIVFRGGWPIFLVGIFSIASGILYTGGPMPLGYIGLGDIFVFIFFGPVAVCGTFYVQALELPPEVFIAGLGPGFLGMALLSVNNLRDEPTDKKSGKKTLAVRLGQGFARAEFIITIFLSIIIPVFLAFYINSHWFICISILIVIPGYYAICQILFAKNGVELNKTLSITGKIILLYGLLFSLGWWVG